MNTDWGNFVSSIGSEVSTEDVDSFENEMGYSLPSDYRRFIVTHNGGRVINRRPISVTIDGDQDEVTLLNLMPLRGGPEPFTGGVVEFWRRWKQSEACPDYWILIGDDGGNGYFFLILKGNFCGHVYFSYADDLFIECADFSQDPDVLPSCFGKVSDSFSGLLHKLA